MKKKINKYVENHIIYGLPDNKKRQSDITHFITEGAHTVITDVQYSIALNDRMAGWALIWEGLKRIMNSDIEAYNKKHGFRKGEKCQPKQKSTGKNLNPKSSSLPTDTSTKSE